MESFSQYPFGSELRWNPQNYDRRNVFNFDLLVDQLAQIENSRNRQSTVIDDHHRVYAPLAASTPTSYDYREPTIFNSRSIDYSNSQNRYGQQISMLNDQKSMPQSAYDQWSRPDYRRSAIGQPSMVPVSNNQWSKIDHREEIRDNSYGYRVENENRSKSNFPKPIGHGRYAPRQQEEDPEQGLWADILKTKPKPKRIPSRDYVCFNCHGKLGHHHVKDCPRVYPDDIKVTPYQGKNECVSEFQCKKCKHSWISHHLQANQSEKCKKCKSDWFPFKQHPPEDALTSGLYDKPKYGRYRQKYIEQCMKLIDMNKQAAESIEMANRPQSITSISIGVWSPVACDSDVDSGYDRTPTIERSIGFSSDSGRWSGSNVSPVTNKNGSFSDQGFF